MVIVMVTSYEITEKDIESSVRMMILSQISYSLVVIFELNSVSEVQYKEIMIIGDE